MKNRDNWQEELKTLIRREKKARQILGVGEMDGVEKIKQAWRELVFQYHPDRNNGSLESQQMFVLVNAAYNCLTRKQDCEVMDTPPAQDGTLVDGKYILNNSWGYFLWWRDKYFDPF